ncbi:MAG: hypothetical protein IK092_01605, partial [Muribaculaceae bacterium]|nr:hypothetical protein [Muribaculaceae bacterium]
MKRLVAILILVATICLGAKASTTLDVQGTVYTVDTLFYNQVGPGTMQTSLLLKSGTKKLRVFYLTIDMTNPLLKLRSVMATDHLAGNETVSNMAQRKSKPGSRYFAGINADFFFLSGTTARGASKVGTPEGSAVVDGEIYRARNSSTSYYKHFIVDKDDNLYINPFFFGGSIVGPRGLSATLGGVNARANETAASNRNKVTIYNDFYYGSTDEVGTGSEVEAML